MLLKSNGRGEMGHTHTHTNFDDHSRGGVQKTSMRIARPYTLIRNQTATAPLKGKVQIRKTNPLRRKRYRRPMSDNPARRKIRPATFLQKIPVGDMIGGDRFGVDSTQMRVER